jgi:hypothetical protein
MGTEGSLPTTVYTNSLHFFLSWVKSIQSLPLPSYFYKINFTVILPSIPWSSKWSPSLRFHHESPICTYLLHHRSRIPDPSQSSCFLNPNNMGIWRGRHILKLLTLQHSPLPCYLVLLKPKWLPQHPTLDCPQPMFLFQFDRPRFTPL